MGPSSELIAPSLAHFLATPPLALRLHLGLCLLVGYCGHHERGGSCPLTHPHKPSLSESSVGKNKHSSPLYFQRSWGRNYVVTDSCSATRLFCPLGRGRTLSIPDRVRGGAAICFTVNPTYVELIYSTIITLLASCPDEPL